MDEKKLKRKDRFKAVRTVLELILIFAVIVWAIYSLVSYRFKQQLVHPTAELDGTLIPSSEIVGGLTPAGSSSEPHFIAISYNGLTDTMRESGRIVTKALYEEQIQAIKASGYQTVTQQDLIEYYNNGKPLPDKALFLLFEDGIMNTALLGTPALIKSNYIATACTYANNLTDEEGHYITAQEMKKLNETSYWESGSNGYRLSYINVFDRFGNYFGNLNIPEFTSVHTYLKRDYNHYLMDFIRDENRIRTESVEEMDERIAWDYNKMQEIYEKELGYMPGVYVLMHSNTGAYGNDPLVSRKNSEMMKSIYSLNFNRQGTCLNTRESSPYDLSRLQSREFFSANHLLMRIWDDTGEDVVFRLGNPKKAADWNRVTGVAEFKKRKIVLTTLPYDEGKIGFAKDLPADLDISVRLQGNVVGQQAIKLRTDKNGDGGISVRLHNNVLLIEDDVKEQPLFKLDLFEFDGGPFVSCMEEELQGKIALAEAIVEYDENPKRVAEAKQSLETLRNTRVPGIADGAKPYIPDLDISDHGDRTLRIRLEGSHISVWLDNKLVADKLDVSSGAGTGFFLEAAVTKDTDRFSQTNLSDDVYDAEFTDLQITGTDKTKLYSYDITIPSFFEDGPVGRFLDKIIDLFHWFYSIGKEKIDMDR